MEVVSYKCPSCAAVLHFDSDTNSWKCDHCASTFSLDQLQGTEQVQQNDATFELPSSYGDDATIFTCPNCGGRVVTDTNTTASFCAYCHNPTVIASRMEDEYRPERLIPFAISKARALDAVRAFCRRFPLLPKNFNTFIQNGEITGLYVPFWLFDGHVAAQMQAEGRNVQTWSDSKYRYTKTDTYLVERDANTDFAGVPADGSKRLDDNLMQSLEPYDYGTLLEFTMQYLSGFYAESYDMDAAAVTALAKERMDQAMQHKIRENIGGYSTIDIKRYIAQHNNLGAHYVLLPVWLLTGQYNGKIYTLALNGQTGKVVGSLPVNWGKLYLWTFLAFVIGFLIVYILGMVVAV